MSKKVEEFNVKIEREGRFFVVIINFPDGEERVTQGNSLSDAYDMLADLLKIRIRGAK